MKVLFLDIDGVLNSHSWWERRDHLSLFDPSTWKSLYERTVWDIDPEGLLLIEQIVMDTDCSIVISSSWRCLHPLDDIWSTLNDASSFGLQRGTLIDRERIIDKTPDAWKDFPSTPSSWGDVRGREIAAWLEKHPKVTSYAIVDDDGDMTEEQKAGHFVRTSVETGITEAQAERLTEILNG